MGFQACASSSTRVFFSRLPTESVGFFLSEEVEDEGDEGDEEEDDEGPAARAKMVPRASA
jgi:hypothetical protein